MLFLFFVERRAWRLNAKVEEDGKRGDGNSNSFSGSIFSFLFLIWDSCTGCARSNFTAFSLFVFLPFD